MSMSHHEDSAPPSDRDTNSGDDAGKPCSASPYAHLYAKFLHGLDSPFAKFLKRMHGVSTNERIGSPLGIGSYSSIGEIGTTELLPVSESGALYFKDNWACALTYRHRPLELATDKTRADDTIADVIEKAEEWIECLYKAMVNVENVNNKPKSVELNIFKSPQLDKKAVEAACRSIFIALIHRCVVGFCGLRSTVATSREDKKLSCMDRLLTVISALSNDKRICKDVLTEDSKVAFLVHAPHRVIDNKKNQEKGNDVKRGLLSEASAARRSRASSSFTSGDSREGSNVPVSGVVSGPAPVLPSTTPSCTIPMQVNGRVEPVVDRAEAQTSKKRTHIKMEDEDTDGEIIKRTRIGVEEPDSDHTKDTRIKLEEDSAEVVMYLETKKVVLHN